MREKLKEIHGDRRRFIATFERFGSKKAFKGPPIITLLFNDIRDKNGKKYSDHLWFTMNKTFKSLDLKPGEMICFDARVKKYTKGYRGYYRDDEVDYKPISEDYKLSHPTNVVKHVVGEQGTLFNF